MAEVTIALVHSDPTGGITFMVQTLNEHEVYRVARLGEVASVFIGDREIWNCGSPNVCKTFKAYLRRRFHIFQIMDFSDGIQEIRTNLCGGKFPTVFSARADFQSCEDGNFDSLQV